MVDSKGPIKFEEKQRQVAQHLRQYKRITPRIAVEKYDAYRLSSIIQRLRNKGWEIITEKVPPTGYARYILVSAPEEVKA